MKFRIKWLILACLLIGSCKPTPQIHVTLTVEQWEDIFDITLIFINQTWPDSISTNSINLYHHYENEKSLETVYNFYINGQKDFNYTPDQNVINEIVERQNIEIECSLKNLPSLAITFVKDTIDLKTNLFFISQPLFIKENLINIVFRLKQPETKITNNWVFVFKRENQTLNPIAIYDEKTGIFWEQHDL